MDKQLGHDEAFGLAEPAPTDEIAARDAHPSLIITATLELAYPPGQLPSWDDVQEYLRVQLNVPEPDDPDQPFTLRSVLSVSALDESLSPRPSMETPVAN